MYQTQNAPQPTNSLLIAFSLLFMFIVLLELEFVHRKLYML